MLTDLQQPAKHWLADAVLNFQTLLNEGDDPSFTLTVGGAVIEIRLNEAPGIFSRKTIGRRDSLNSREQPTGGLAD